MRTVAETAKLPFEQLLHVLYDEGLAFLGTNLVKDDSAMDSPLGGYVADGRIPCIVCSDLFFWGAADAVSVVPSQRGALTDCILLCDALEAGCELFCCRTRKMRPQGAAYSFIEKQLWPLFDECGPERKTGIGNPYEPGEYPVRGARCA